MILINGLNNEDAVGKMVTASIALDNAWVEYGDGNNGEANYYRDVHSKDGCLIYSEGEQCKIEGFDEKLKTVALSNENIDVNDFPETFTILYEQYVADFGLKICN